MHAILVPKKTHSNVQQLRKLKKKLPHNSLSMKLLFCLNRFMPEGIYLNGWRLGPEALANRMNDIIKDKNQYYKFFKWHGYYSFHFTGEDNYHREVCGLCELLNDNTKRRHRGWIINISEWWNESPTTTTSTYPLLTILDEEEDDDVRGLWRRIYKFVFQ